MNKPWIGHTTRAGLRRIKLITSAHNAKVSFNSSWLSIRNSPRSWPLEKTGPSDRSTITFGRLSRSPRHADASTSHLYPSTFCSMLESISGLKGGRRSSLPLGEVLKRCNCERNSRRIRRERALRFATFERWRYAARAGKGGKFSSRTFGDARYVVSLS